MLRLLRYLRHGPLRRFSPFWLWLGENYRRCVRGTNLVIRQRIGPYGPFRLDARFAFSNFSNWGGGHNDGFRDCVKACRGKECVIDVGAHIGLVSLPALSVMAPAGTLVAFEPATANRNLLLRHLELNGYSGRARVESALVGAEERAETQFFEMREHTGMNTVVPGAMDGRYESVARQQTTLDAYCARHDLAPDVIKIDVEGAELAVLEGGRDTIGRCRPLIFLSVHPRQIRLLGQTPELLMQLIESLGYVCRHVDGSPVTTFALREYILTSRENTL
jgi:FkbM family methyltransferase